MITLRTALAFAAAVSAAAFVYSAEMAPPQLKSIFNGQDLSGWKVTEGDRAIWFVENGSLVGRSNAKMEGSIIATDKPYKNFIMEFDVKYLPPADSGVTMRTPPLQMQIGTSASLRTELTGSFYLGALGYTDYSTAKETWKHFKPGDWNTIRIQARGAIFTVWVNGQLVIRYADEKHADPGPLTFQVHQNFDMRVEFKNVRVAELP
jgi:hypothetical protein